MKFDPDEPPYGQDSLFHWRFIKRASFNHQKKWFVQVKSHLITVPERYSDRDGQANATAPVEQECL